MNNTVLVCLSPSPSNIGKKESRKIYTNTYWSWI